MSLVVLYKVDIETSTTIASIQSQELKPDVVVIWDNSPKSQTESVIQKQKDLNPNTDWFYIHTPENIPLSQVYNHVMSNYDYTLITILDQDSQLPENFFAQVKSDYLNNPNIDLFLPVLVNGSLIVSPGAFYLVKGVHWKKQQSGKVKSKNLMAINSGMTITKNYVESIFPGYDERLSLYGLDVYFMIKYAELRSQAFVMNLVIEHDSALRSNLSKEDMIYRWRNRREAWNIIHSQSLLRKVLSRVYAIFQSVKYALKYKDLRFFK